VTLHLGGDVIISMKDVIAIFDIETSMTSEVNKEFLEIAKEEGFIKKISKNDPKTFVLAELDHKTMIFLSPISSSTLLKRTGFVKNISSTNSK
jgi:ribosomal protein S8